MRKNNLMTIKKQSSQIPSLPGVYFFKNSLGKIIYVGKALNLKNRLNSYHLGVRHLSGKMKFLLKEAVKLEWQILESEIEALIKESELIKKYHPKFNVLMRDDKQYFFVTFTKETYPRVYLTHQPFSNQRFIGPFTDGVAIKSVIKLLRKAFPYCTCKKMHKGLCLNARIGKCPGYCCIKTVNHKLRNTNYNKNISSIKKILSGKNTSLLKKIKKEIKKLAKEQKYEEAGKIRDQIRALEKIFLHKEIISRDIVSENIKSVSALETLLKIKEIKKIEAYDVANIQGKYAYGSMVVFIDGEPAKDLYRIFKIKTIDGVNDTAMLKEIISRRLTHKEWRMPEVILVDGGKQQLNVVAKVFINSSVKIIALTKDKNHKGDHIYISGKIEPLSLNGLPLSLKNFLMYLDFEAHRFAIRYYRQEHRKVLILN